MYYFAHDCIYLSKDSGPSQVGGREGWGGQFLAKQLREPSQIAFAFFGIWPHTYLPSLHFLCSKSSIFLTTYLPLNANVICEGSLIVPTQINVPSCKLKKLHNQTYLQIQ